MYISLIFKDFGLRRTSMVVITDTMPHSNILGS